jgi:hypothetical protein
MRRRDDRGNPLLMQPKTQRHSSGEIDRAVIKSWQNMRVEIKHGPTESPPLLKNQRRCRTMPRSARWCNQAIAACGLGDEPNLTRRKRTHAANSSP